MKLNLSTLSLLLCKIFIIVVSDNSIYSNAKGYTNENCDDITVQASSIYPKIVKCQQTNELICTNSAKLTTIAIDAVGQQTAQLVDCNDYTIGNYFRQSTSIDCVNGSIISYASKCQACCKFYAIVNNGHTESISYNWEPNNEPNQIAATGVCNCCFFQRSKSCKFGPVRKVKKSHNEKMIIEPDDGFRQQCTQTTTVSSLSTTTIAASTTAAESTTATATPTTTAATTSTTTTTCTTTLSSNSMTDCYDWRFKNCATSSGIYQINPGGELGSFDVYCDMTTEGGGWTVIQRQVNDSSEMWNNTWQQYKDGFNNSIENGSLWLGNDRINVMSSQWNVTLRVEIYGDRYTNASLDHNTNPNIYLYGEYNFSISDEMNNYTLQISRPIEGNASDANTTYGFIYNNGMPFSTVDKSSNADGSDCAYNYQYGGWWFNFGCTYVALNGEYNPSGLYNGFIWFSDTTGPILPYRSEMKIRRKQ